MTMINSDPSRMNLSFSGCGFLCLYHAGVAAAIKEYAPELMQKGTISGASAGAIVAAGLVTDVCISQATSTMLRIVREARSSSLGVISPNFDLMGLVKEEIRRYLPPDAYIRCSARLKISVTRWSDKKNVILEDFANNDELVDGITCSCFIPGVCGVILPTFRGVRYVDGGFSDNLPLFDDHTVTVSPFSGESDICPLDYESAGFFDMTYNNTSMRFTTMNFFRLIAILMPPSLEDCTKMCLQGFSDTVRFLTRNNMTTCIKCLTIQTNMGDAVPNPPPSQASMVSSSSDTSRPFSPPTRSRTRSANYNGQGTRKRFDSECDTCGDSDHMHNADLVFPSIIQRTFDEASKAEATFLKWVFSFRLMKMTRMVFGIWKYPLDVMLIMAKRIASYIHTVACPDWLFKKFSDLVDFMYEEIDRQRSQLSARYSCQLAITECDFESSGQSNLKEHFGEIELSEEARQELAQLRERDRRMKQRKGTKITRPSRLSCELSPVDPNLRKASLISHSPAMGTSQQAEEGSLSQVIEYTATHEATYAFHYLDENNKVRNVEVFNVAEERPCSIMSRGITKSVPEENEEELQAELMEASTSNTSNPVPINSPEKKGDENDSGLSVEEGNSSGLKRDACCSPVRHLSHSSTRGSRTSISKRSHSIGQTQRKNQVVGIRDLGASSDSDGETGEQFFVPRGRRRMTSAEYEGEPEHSDEEKQ